MKMHESNRRTTQSKKCIHFRGERALVFWKSARARSGPILLSKSTVRTDPIELRSAWSKSDRIGYKLGPPKRLPHIYIDSR